MTSETEETVLDLAWLSQKLEAERDGGHCGESTSEKIDRQRRNRRIARILAALSRAPEAEDLGGSTRMTSPASRSQTSLSAGWQDISGAPRDSTGAILSKLKENGLSREELGGSARASRGAAGPSDCAEGDARLSDGGRG